MAVQVHFGGVSKRSWKAGNECHNVLYYVSTTETQPGAIRDRAFKLTRATRDPGRDRTHLSRIEGTEAHEVSNLYPEVLSKLQNKHETMRTEVGENPRGWTLEVDAP